MRKTKFFATMPHLPITRLKGQSGNQLIQYNALIPQLAIEQAPRSEIAQIDSGPIFPHTLIFTLSPDVLSHCVRLFNGAENVNLSHLPPR